MSSSTSQTQESVPSQRISEASDQSDSGYGGTSVAVSNIDNTNDSTSSAIDSKKRSRAQGEDSSSEDSDHPSKKAKSAPRFKDHPSLLNVRTAVKDPHLLPSPFNLLIGTPPTRLNCGICLDAFSHQITQNLARHAQCAPIYHTACLERWAKEGSPTCPNCRGRLKPLPPVTPDFDRAHWILETVISGFVNNFTASGVDRFMLAFRREFGFDDEGGYEDDVEVEEEEQEEEEEEEEEEGGEVIVRQHQQDQAADEDADGDQQQEEEGSRPRKSQVPRPTPSDRSFWNVI